MTTIIGNVLFLVFLAGFVWLVRLVWVNRRRPRDETPTWLGSGAGRWPRRPR